MRTAIILNPTSGRGRGSDARSKIEGFARAHSLDWTIFETQAHGDATRIAKDCTSDFGLIAAAGGDGTVSEVMRGVLGSDAIMGVLPCGTGNDFARHIGLTASLDRALECLCDGKESVIDVGMLGDQPFLNVVACGFDSEVGLRINNGYRWAKGTTAYVLAVLQTLASYKPTEMEIVVDGTAHQMKSMLCAVANASQYGGGMKVAPQADLTDGFLDVVVVKEMSRLSFLRQFPKVFKGTHLDSNEVVCFRGQEIRISAKRPLPVLNDGDLSGTTPLTATIVKSALRVRMPIS